MADETQQGQRQQRRARLPLQVVRDRQEMRARERMAEHAKRHDVAERRRQAARVRAVQSGLDFQAVYLSHGMEDMAKAIEALRVMADPRGRRAGERGGTERDRQRATETLADLCLVLERSARRLMAAVEGAPEEVIPTPEEIISPRLT